MRRRKTGSIFFATFCASSVTAVLSAAAEDIALSLTKSIGSEFSSDGSSRLVGSIEPDARVTFAGTGGDITAALSSEWRYLPAENDPYLSSFYAGVIGEMTPAALTTARFAASVDGSVPDPDDAALPPLTASPPLSLNWRSEAGFSQRFGAVTAEARANLLRGTMSDTVLEDTSTIDNSEFELSGYGAGGRLGVDLSPVWGIFVDAGLQREAYDAPSTSLGVPLDNLTSRTEAGVSFDHGEDLNGEMSLGVLRRGFDDGSLGEVTAYSASANVSWSPNASTSVTAMLTTELSPTTEPGATTEINHLATLAAAYEATDMLRLRGTVELGRDQLAEVVEQTDTATVGVGVDYLLNRFTTMFANLTGKSIADTTDGDSQSVSIEAGITFSR